MFWDDGTLSGEGKDEQGDYTIRGTFNLTVSTSKGFQSEFHVIKPNHLKRFWNPCTIYNLHYQLG